MSCCGRDKSLPVVSLSSMWNLKIKKKKEKYEERSNKPRKRNEPLIYVASVSGFRVRHKGSLS